MPQFWVSFSPTSIKFHKLILNFYLGCQVADLANEETPQLYLSCGRGPRSSIRVLRHGLEVSEMAVSELPGNPNAVWTVKKRIDG